LLFSKIIIANLVITFDFRTNLVKWKGSQAMLGAHQLGLTSTDPVSGSKEDSAEFLSSHRDRTEMLHDAAYKKQESDSVQLQVRHIKPGLSVVGALVKSSDSFPVLNKAEESATKSWLEKAMPAADKSKNEEKVNDQVKNKKRFFSGLKSLSKSNQPPVRTESRLPGIPSLVKKCTEEYTGFIYKLMQDLHKDNSSSSSITIVCEDGRLSLPLAVLILAWPELAAIVKNASCCSDDIAVSLPGRLGIVQHVVELMACGQSSPLCTKDIVLIKKFLGIVGLNWDIEQLMLNDDGKDTAADEDTVIIGECFSDDEESFTFDPNDEGFSSTAVTEPSQATLCSSSCSSQCFKFCESWSSEDLTGVKEGLKSEQLWMTKNKLINHLAAQSRIGVSSDEYMIKGHVFCIKFLSFMTGISDYILSKVIEDYGKGVRVYNHGNAGVMKQQTMATTQFICWFKEFLVINGQSSPEDEVVILAHWMNETALFRIYVDEVCEPRIALSTFYQHIKNFFGPDRIDQSLPCVRQCQISVLLNIYNIQFLIQSYPYIFS
jgi:hypothetical protein